jgi:hypothetical protein
MKTNEKNDFGKSLGKNSTAQGAIEYLLIIGASILVVSIVIISIVGVTGAGADKTDAESVRDTSLILECQRDCILINGNWINNRCEGNVNLYGTNDKCGDFNDPPKNRSNT